MTQAQAVIETIDINGLWIELKTMIRYWDKNAPQEDLNRICGAVFYVVAAVNLMTMKVCKLEVQKFDLKLRRKSEAVPERFLTISRKSVFLRRNTSRNKIPTKTDNGIERR